MITLHESRAARVREEMRRQGLSQILVTYTSSVYYLTGVWITPMERQLALYLDLDGRAVLFGNDLFGLPAGEPPLICRTHNDTDDPVADIAATVRPGRLGIDKWWPSRHLLALMEKRPDVIPVPGSAPVDLCRMRKDKEEIEALRQASKLNDQVMEQAVGFLHEGVTEEETAAFVESCYKERGANRGEGLICSFGPDCADPHHEPDRTVLRPGDSVVLDLFMPMPRYWCDMTRTVFWQTVAPEQQKVYDTVRAANEKAESLIRPGMKMKEIDRAARSLIEDAGYGPQFTHRLGHGLGLDCHEPPDNSQVSETVTEPGMVFSVEPGIYLPGSFGVRVEDLVLVTETGCEVLNSYRKDLQVLK